MINKLDSCRQSIGQAAYIKQVIAYKHIFNARVRLIAHEFVLPIE